MPVPVECESAPPIPTVGHVPQHEVAVELIEAVTGVEERRAKAGPRFVPGECGILSCPGISPWGEHTLGANASSQGCVAGRVTVVLLLRGAVLGPSRRLWPNGANGVEVGLDP